ncbi:SRPBCC family protein [Kibdelosporangium persicum]|uniref:Toxin-antitoxin system toxin subunit n=1 Tax=Kibdelosporangium persicum TaxID=2698649 RepID=A0ABX2EY72_9PSEU|nr:SRPBCC family protein [Kibdelosporangium persicum]NRN63630.1 Toxin-antitoxin system toxin subunit [Kibdelosporangium persicum]
MTERATLSTIDGKPTLRFERRLRHAPTKVWRAVTDPAELAHWFPAAVEAELRPGAPMRFTFPEEAVVDGKWDGEVLEVDPPKVFMFRWNQDVLRFELIPDGAGCLLVFTQTVGGGWIGKLGAGRSAAGWDNCLDAMAARLDGETPQGFDNWLGPIERYVDEFGLGEGTVRRTEDGFELHFARDLVWKPVEEAWAFLVEDSPLTGEPPLRATNDHAPPGRLTVVRAPHTLEYEWLSEGTPAGIVRWTFESDPELGVRVELTQTIPAALAGGVAESLAMWHVHLEMYFAALHGDVRCPWPEERVKELTAHYENHPS